MCVEVDRDDGRGSGPEEGDGSLARGCGSRSHLLGHLADPRGGAVAQVRTSRVPHDLIRQALERSDAWEKKQRRGSHGEIITLGVGN